MSADALPPQIRELFTALDHAGELDQAEGGSIARGEAGREELGTRVRFVMRIADGRVRAVRYRVYGCPYTLATCEWLARTLEGRPPDALEIGNPLDWAQRLEVPAAKLGRLLVVEDALQAALTRR